MASVLVALALSKSTATGWLRVAGYGTAAILLVALILTWYRAGVLALAVCAPFYVLRDKMLGLKQRVSALRSL